MRFIRFNDFRTVKLLFANMQIRGGLAVFWILYLGILTTSHFMYTVQVWVLALWSRQFELKDPADVPSQ